MRAIAVIILLVMPLAGNAQAPTASKRELVQQSPALGLLGRSCPGPVPEDVRRCKRGDARACSDAALGALECSKQALAEKYFDRSCSLGMTLSCINLGELYASADPPRSDRARAMFQKGCDARLDLGELGCRRLRELDSGEPKRPEAAQRPGGAPSLGGLPGGEPSQMGGLQAAAPRPRDSRSTGELEAACLQGQADDCYGFLRRVESQSLGRTRGLAADVKLCELGAHHQCVRAGRSYESGDGTPVDLPRATALYAKACARKWDIAGDGCYELELVRKKLRRRSRP